MEKGNIHSGKMKIEFIKDYYQDTEINKKGEHVPYGEFKTMYSLRISKPYFCADKVKVLKMVIEDLEDELNRLKAIDRQNDINMEKWDSISK